jgi:hypothetical protein
LVALDDGHELSVPELELLFAQAAGAGADARVILCGLPAIRSLVPQSATSGDARHRLPLLPFSALRVFAERVLDVSGYPASPQLLDTIASYSAGRPALLYALLRCLFLELDIAFILPGASIELDLLETARSRTDFRQAMRAILLDPVEASPILNIVFAALLMKVDGRQSISAAADVLKESLDMEKIYLGRDEVRTAMNDLRDLELIEEDPATSEVTLSRSGGYMLLSLIPADTQQYFAEAKARFASHVRLPRVRPVQADDASPSL